MGFDDGFNWIFIDFFDCVNIIYDFVVVVDVEMVKIGVYIWW